MSFVDAFAAFVASVPAREAALPWGRAQVWDLGDGPPVVLLHGIAGGRRVFFRVAPLLAGALRVVVPPLRGENRPCPRSGLEDYLDDVAALLASLDLRDVTLFGTSFGGYLALAYAARGDPRVTSVAIQGGFARYRLRPLDRLALPCSHLVPGWLASRWFVHRALASHESRFLARHAPGLEQLNARWAGLTPFPTLRRRVHLIHRVDLAPRLARIRVPLTLAQGDLDRLVPWSCFERLRRLCPQARAVTWEGVSHIAVLTHPDVVADLLTPGRAPSSR